MTRQKPIIKAPAKAIYQWRGFTLQKGAIYGSLDYKGSKTAFVYMGQKRRVKRPDGSSAGWQIKLFLCQLENGIFYTKEREPEKEFGWHAEWVNVGKSGDYAKIMATNPHVEYYREPADLMSGERNIMAYVPKQKNLGFIYSMVRERQ